MRMVKNGERKLGVKTKSSVLFETSEGSSGMDRVGSLGMGT